MDMSHVHDFKKTRPINRQSTLCVGLLVAFANKRIQGGLLTLYGCRLSDDIVDIA